MIEDFRAIPNGARVEADVCIVGAGPAGLALAWRLAQLRPRLRIVLVESGGIGLDQSAQRLNGHGEVVGLPFRGHGPNGRARAFGGTGRLWAGQCLPFDSIDFEQRLWVPFSGWPVSAAEIAPYVGIAETFFHVGGRFYDTRNYPLFGLEAPGWSAEALRTVFTVYSPRVDVGADRLAEFRRSETVRVLLHATVASIETNAEGTRAEALRLVAPGGKAALLRSPSIALCAGGLENARLLLLSTKACPHGLGNARGLVGRFLQDHPTAVTAALAPQDLPCTGDLQDRFRLFYGKRGLRYFPKFALGDAAQRRHQVLNCVGHLVFDYPDDSAQPALRDFVHALRRRRLPDLPLRKLARIAGGVGEVAAAARRRYLHGLSPRGRPAAIRLQCHLEQAPRPESRVSLSPCKRDDLGLPALRIDWRLGELERRTLQVMTDAVQAEFARLGLGVLRPAAWLHAPDADWTLNVEDCYHHLGTTRMAGNPDGGVVDPECQVFGVDGLYVAGGSVFPTSGYANPTLMMAALAARLADRIASRSDATPASAAPGAPASRTWACEPTLG